MGRTDEANLLINSSPARVYKALTDPRAIEEWLPQAGMKGHFEKFDPRPGGLFRLVLTRPDAADESANSADDGVIESTFIELTPAVRVVQGVDFGSGDPAYEGPMRMTWEVAPHGASAHVLFRVEGIPADIPEEVHLPALTSTLQNLAAYLEHYLGAVTERRAPAQL